MIDPRRLRLAGLLPVLVGCGCTSTDPAAQAVQVSVAVRPDGIRPRPDVTIERYGSVCFFNDGAPGSSFDVVFERGFPDSMPCSTTLRFVQRDGATRTAQPVDTGQCAVLCFHHPGRYPYRILGAQHDLTGVVVVRGGER